MKNARMFRLLNEVCCNIFERIAAMPLVIEDPNLLASRDGAINVCLRLHTVFLDLFVKAIIMKDTNSLISTITTLLRLTTSLSTTWFGVLCLTLLIFYYYYFWTSPIVFLSFLTPHKHTHPGNLQFSFPNPSPSK